MASATAALTEGAQPRVIPAGQALVLDPGTAITLHLRDGSKVNGRFLGRALLDSAIYLPRFEEHVRSSPYAPFAWGETLRVSLRDGREWTAPFAGYAELTLLLGNPDPARPPLRVPFEFAREIRRTNGDRVEPSVLVHAFHAHFLPSAEALVVGEPSGSVIGAEAWDAALRVAVDDIASATVKLPSAKGAGDVVLLDVMVTLAVITVIVVLIAHSIHDANKQSSSGCTGPQSVPFDFSEAHLTTRPFDRSRGCFVDDPLAVADPWPAETPVHAFAALSDSAASPAGR